MRTFIYISMIAACSVFSLQAMLRERTARLVATSVLRTYMQPRLLSSTPTSAQNYDDAFSWRIFAVRGKEAWDSVYKKPNLLAQLTRRYQSDCGVELSDAEFSDDDNCEIARLFNGVAAINNVCQELKLRDLRFYTPSHGADVIRKLHVKDRYPLVAAAETLSTLDDAITTIIPEIQNVVPLESEIKQFQSNQKVIRDILDAIKSEPQWVDQSLAAYICEDVAFTEPRLQED